MIRVTFAVLFNAFVLLAFSSCATEPREGGAPPSMMKPFIDRPGGSQIHYRDSETAHVITLNENGTYLFESMGINDGVSATRQGGWGWKKLDSHHAVLVLDQDKWRLTFVSPESAMAHNEAGARSYAFQFSR